MKFFPDCKYFSTIYFYSYFDKIYRMSKMNVLRYSVHLYTLVKLIDQYDSELNMLYQFWHRLNAPNFIWMWQIFNTLKKLWQCCPLLITDKDVDQYHIFFKSCNIDQKFTKSIQSELYGLRHAVNSTSPLKVKILLTHMLVEENC